MLVDQVRRILTRSQVHNSQPIDAHFSILQTFVSVYCRDHHAAPTRFRPPADICEECQDLLRYARKKLERCPYAPKPPCKECPTHCYKRNYRDRIRAVMRYSGMYFVKRGRIDWLLRYFLLEGLPKPRTHHRR